MYDSELQEFVRYQMEKLTYLCSVCTGAFILAETGLLKGLKATTHHTAMNGLRESYGNTDVVMERVVKNRTRPKIWLAAGVTSGIDLSLEIIGELFDHETKSNVARLIEYPSYEW